MLLLKLWDRMEEQVGGLFLLAAVLLVFGQIVLRAVFGIGISGIYELAAFCSTFSVFLTASLGVRRNTHIRVDLVSNLVPRKVAYALEVLVQILMLAVALCLSYSGYLLVEESLMLGDHTTGTIEVPMWVPQLIMPVAGMLITLRALQRLLLLARGGALEPAASELPVT